MVLKRDYPYIIAAIFLSVLAAASAVNPSESIGTYAFLGLIGVGVIMAIMINPSLGANILFITIFTNVSSELTNMGLPGVNKPLVAIVFVAVMVRSYYVGQLPLYRPKTSRIEMALVVYFLVVTASFLVASDRDLTMERILDLGKDILIIYCILFCIRRFKEWKDAFFLIVITTTILSLLGIYQVATGNYSQTFFGFASVDLDLRLGGPINEPNMWGQVIVAVMPFTIFGFMHSASVRQKFIYAGSFIVLFIELLNTYSRGGYLSFFVVILIIMIFYARLRLSFVLSVIAIVILVFPLIPQQYVERFQSLFLLSSNNQSGIYEEASFRGRTSEYLTGITMLSEHPLLGVGAANYPVNYQKYAQIIGLEVRSENREAHSLYIEILAETGIIGFIAFAGVIFFLFRGLANAKTQVHNLKYFSEWETYISAVQVSLIGYLFATIFLHGAYIRYFWMLTALAITLIQIIYEAVEQQSYFRRSEKI